MFELTEQDVFRLVDFFNQSDIAFLHVRSAGAEVLLSRDAAAAGSLGGAPAPLQVAAPTPAAAPASAAAPAPVATPVPTPAPAAAPNVAISAGPGEALITCQSVGVFYRAPRPDLPAYVEVGTRVEPETTVGLIEAMKVFTGVAAEIGGTITEILVTNEQFVEFGQPLFRISLEG
jgi:acetyl-CoA carboxylase biotin carboxyl carrier protein